MQPKKDLISCWKVLKPKSVIKGFWFSRKGPAFVSLTHSVLGWEQLMKSIASEKTQAMHFSSWDPWSMKLTAAAHLSGPYSLGQLKDI